MAATFLLHHQLVLPPPTETAKVSFHKIVSLRATSISISPMRLRDGRGPLRMLAFLVTLVCGTWKFRRANTFLVTSDFLPKHLFLSLIVGYAITWLSGDGRIYGELALPFLVFINKVQAYRSMGTVQSAPCICTQCDRTCIWCTQEAILNPPPADPLPPRYPSTHSCSTLHRPQLHHVAPSKRPTDP